MRSSDHCRQGEGRRTHGPLCHHEGEVGVAEAGSKLTEPDVWHLLLRRCFFQTFSFKLHGQFPFMFTRFSEICSVLNMR